MSPSCEIDIEARSGRLKADGDGLLLFQIEFRGSIVALAGEAAAPIWRHNQISALCPYPSREPHTHTHTQGVHDGLCTTFYDESMTEKQRKIGA